MGKERSPLTGEVSREREVDQIRKAARQFALLYFHFSKVLYDQFGLEKAKDIIRQVVFEQAVDRAEQLRQQAKALGNGTDTVEDFHKNIDLPFDGWIAEWGEDHCPYGKSGGNTANNIPGSKNWHPSTVM